MEASAAQTLIVATPAAAPPPAAVAADAPAPVAAVTESGAVDLLGGRTTMWIAVALLVAAIAAAIAMTAVAVSNLPDDLPEQDKRCEVHAIVTTGVMSAMMLAWPLLFHVFMGLDTLARHPVALLGFAWPILLSVSDVLSRKRSPALFDPSLAGTMKEDDVRGGPSDFSDSKLGSEALSITTLVFAMGTLFVHTLSKRQLAYTVPALKWALLLGISFVIPDTYQDPGSVAGATIQALKKSAFNMAVGLVVTGIVLDVMFTGRRRDAIHHEEMERESKEVDLK